VGQALRTDTSLLFIVNYKTPLSMVVSEFEEIHFLQYLDEHGTESIISRSDFITRLIITSTRDQTLGEWIHEVLPDYGLETFPKLQHVQYDDGLGRVMELMLESNAREVCVMDDANKIVGVITYDQIVEHAVHDFMLERTIKERRSVGA